MGVVKTFAAMAAWALGQQEGMRLLLTRMKTSLSASSTCLAHAFTF